MSGHATTAHDDEAATASAGVVLRRAVREDLAALIAVERAAPTVGWSDATFAAELERDDRRWVVAEVEEMTVGAGGVADLAGDAHVLSVAVRPEHRGRGVGTAVVRWLVSAARTELRSAGVTLEVRRSNTAARALYRRCGFTEAGVRPGYYRGGEDAVVLWCADPSRTEPGS